MRTLAISVLSTIAAASIFAAEKKIRVSDLPAAVQSAMKQQIHGATIVGASSERENGKITYEVETRKHGRGRDLTFDSNGSLLEVEQQINIADVPEAARQAIQRRAAGGAIRKVEAVTRGSNTSYEADVETKSGGNAEISVNADGTPHREL